MYFSKSKMKINSSIGQGNIVVYKPPPTPPPPSTISSVDSYVDNYYCC
ncbi:hypothetical protein DERF_016041 [Dermatophagoides farinae]|uniref:Uncharacterized protein n=1 Tax=Dermatophagoides farinae TaxID=6954 RepID=A0A922HN39_DERFA|nr:hypothetical protein DERF_016041 [Dermatophagoides farinae]